MAVSTPAGGGAMQEPEAQVGSVSRGGAEGSGESPRGPFLQKWGSREGEKVVRAAVDVN